MSEKRELDNRENLKVVTSNSFITSQGLEKMSLKARKLLYIAISQCRLNDDKFYEFEITVPEFAKMMDIDESNIYKEVDKITDELITASIKAEPEKGKKFTKYPVMSMCEYNDEKYVKIELNPRMTSLLLNIKKDFSQPLLADFLRMNSPYSMAIWHLMQKEMNSKKPFALNTIEFDVSLEELRNVTGTQDKYLKIGMWKVRVFDKALREIKDNCGIEIEYTDKKRGRSVVGFHCIAQSALAKNADEKTVRKCRYIELKQKVAHGQLTQEEDDEYQMLMLEFDQMSLF